MLPSWNGATQCYTRAYTLLNRMAQNGHVTRSKVGRRFVCCVSAEMTMLIDALNSGNEEYIKGILLDA